MRSLALSIFFFFLIFNVLANPKHPHHDSILSSSEPSSSSSSAPNFFRQSNQDPSPHSEEQNKAIKRLMNAAEIELTVHHNGNRALKLFRLAAMLGHSAALSSAAVLLLSGEASVEPDLATAVHHLRLASKADQSNANSLLGLLHASGLADRYGVPQSDNQAIKHWMHAADKGNVYASTALGFRYYYGISVPRSCSSAAHFYTRAARAIATDSRNWPTPENFLNSKPPLPDSLKESGLRRLEEDIVADQNHYSEDADVVPYYQHAASRGDYAAMTALGALHYYGGYGINPNENRARDILMAAADANRGDAHIMLGHMAMRKRQEEEAVMHFRNAAAFGNGMGHYAMGMLYLHGLLGFEKDFSKAAGHFEIAAQTGKGHADSSFELGQLLWNGRGRKRDIERAFTEFRKAAHLGNIQAKFHVGRVIFQGSPPANLVNCNLGVKLLKEVAEQGEWRTLFDLASNALDNGDEYGALYRYMQAAYAGIEISQFNAALILESRGADDAFPQIAHWSRRRRLAEAHKLYGYSGLQGHTDSLIRSGNVHYTESKNYNAAARAYEWAARLENPEGMVSLSLMYARGVGVRKDRETALQYLATAKSTSREAITPAVVAYVGLQVYWKFIDLKARLGHQSMSGKLAEPSSRKRLGGEGTSDQIRARAQRSIWKTPTFRLAMDMFLADFPVVITLFVALCVVLFLREKRMADQQNLANGHAQRTG